MVQQQIREHIEHFSVPTSQISLYGKIKFRVTNAVCDTIRIYYSSGLSGFGDLILLNNPIENEWYEISNINAGIPSETTGALFISHIYADAATSDNKELQIQYILVVDETTDLGSGKEYTETQMDTILNYNYPDIAWFDGQVTILSLGLNDDKVFSSKDGVVGLYDLTDITDSILTPLKNKKIVNFGDSIFGESKTTN